MNTPVKKTRLDELRELYTASSLSTVLDVKKESDYPEKSFSALRFQSNPFRIRAIEIWEQVAGRFFRIYHSDKMAAEIKAEIDSFPGLKSSTATYSDHKGDFAAFAKSLYDIMSSDKFMQVALDNPVITRNTAYEGLALPDVDTSEAEIIGKVFSWKEIIAISEDTSPTNILKGALSQSGVYLQRSLDGKSRYVGSAYNEGGFLTRWMKHLTSNGHAKHLNLYVLENGYSNIVFTVLEVTGPEPTQAIAVENKWKAILGTKNSGPYDGFRLNSN